MIKRIAALVGTFSLAVVTAAAPLAYSSDDTACSERPQNLGRGDTLLRDSRDCDQYYVLPPDGGVVRTEGLVPSANLMMCDNMKQLDGFMQAAVAEMDELVVTQKTINEKRQRVKKELKKAQKREADLYAEPLLRELTELREILDDTEIRIDKTYKQYYKVKDRKTAKELKQEISRLKKISKKTREQWRSLRRENRRLTRKYERAKRRVKHIKSQIKQLSRDFSDYTQMIASIENSLFQTYKKYAQLEGGYTTISYKTGWTEALERLRNENPNFHFQKINAVDVRIAGHYIGSSSEKNYLASLPAILDYSMNGYKMTPWGKERKIETSGVPDHLRGSLRLSLVGACPMAYSNFFDKKTTELEQHPDMRARAYDFGLTVNYQYPVTYDFEVDATYNVWAIYKRLTRRGTRGGFFTRRTWNEVLEENFGDDEMNIKIYSNNPNAKDNHQKLEKMIKHELIERVMKLTSMPVGKTPEVITPITDFPPSGASLVSKAYDDQCGRSSYYCKGMSWVFKILDATFSSTEATTKFKRQYNMTATYKVSRRNTEFTTGAVTYEKAESQ